MPLCPKAHDVVNIAALSSGVLYQSFSDEFFKALEGFREMDPEAAGHVNGRAGATSEHLEELLSDRLRQLGRLLRLVIRDHFGGRREELREF